MGGAWFSKSWRDLPRNSKIEENLDFLKSYQPRNKEIKHLRIMLIGPVGAGKSSFINSVDSVLQKRIICRAPADAVTGGSSFTQDYTTYKISKDPEEYYSFMFSDLMGFERSAERGVHVEDIKLALKGHVKDGYTFKPEQHLTEGDFYNPHPTLSDRVHVLIFVIAADKVSIMKEEDVKKMREIRLAARQIRIPQLAIFTRIDEACPEVKGDIRCAHKSNFLKEKVEKISELLGIPPNCIFVLKNYHSETKTNKDINALILLALRQMVSVGEDFLNDLQV